MKTISEAMKRVISVLVENGENFSYENGEIVLNDLGGQIYELENDVGFTHGNCEIAFNKNSPELESIVEKYIGGFDAFENFVKTMEK